MKTFLSLSFSLYIVMIIVITSFFLSCCQYNNSELAQLPSPDTVILILGDAHDTTSTKPIRYHFSMYDQNGKEVILSKPGIYKVSVGIEGYDVKMVIKSGSDNVKISKIDSIYYKIEVMDLPDGKTKMDATIYYLPDTLINVILLHVKWKSQGDSLEIYERILQLDTVSTDTYFIKK